MILDRIAGETGVSIDDLSVIVRTASRRYKTYSIPKRTGGRRTINHPTPELKFLQRWMTQNLFGVLPVHHAVTSYRNGVGIAHNARLHASQNYLLKIDFADFFPSISAEDVRSIMVAHSMKFDPQLTNDDITVVVETVCKNGALTIGAPSSPALSNAILYDFDLFVFEACQARHVVYSRYADDIFLSTDEPNRLSNLLEVIRAKLAEGGSPVLRINEDKTVFTSRKRRRVVTGLVLTSDCRLSIGRKKKRQIRSMIHSYENDDLAVDEVSYLRGYLAFVNSVEPDFLDRLRQKYGTELLDQIMGEATVARK